MERSLSSEQQTSLGDLYRLHSRWLASAIRRMGGLEPTEDVVQEAYARLARYPSETVFEHPKALLLTIARNVVYEAARRRRGAVLISLSRDDQQEEDQPVAADQFEQLALKQIVLSLPEPCREVFILNRFAGLTYEDIAKNCNLSVKTVEKRMSRALKVCATRLRE